MDPKPLVSIIMPVYNSDRYLEKSIASLTGQSMRSVEIICVNDCSSDGSLDILKRLAEKDGRIKIVNNSKNIGPGLSRNIGIKKSRGEFVCFVDSDDWLETNACDILYRKAKESGADIVFIKPKIVFGNRIDLDGRLLSEDDVKNNDVVFRKTLLRKVAWAPWSKFIRRDLLIKNKIQFPDIYITEDMDFSYKAIYYAKKITFAKEYLYNYYLREDSLTSFTRPERRLDNYFESIRLLETFLRKKGILKKYYREFVYFKLYTYLAAHGVMYHSGGQVDKKKYKSLIRRDSDFTIGGALGLGKLDSVICGSLLIKLGLFNPVFKIREFFRFLGGKKRAA